MILTSNQQLLMKQFPMVWNAVKQLDESVLDSSFQVLEAKNGMSTLKASRDKELFFHSKYDPAEEAVRFAAQYEDVNKYEHIFFYGIGLGYHIELLMNQYPSKTFTLYEPSMDVFYRYLENKSLKDLPIKQLKHIFVEQGTQESINFLSQFVNTIKGEILVVALPSYERIFPDKYRTFSEQFLSIMNGKTGQIRVHSSYDKRWLFNSMINFPTTATTASIFNLKPSIFRGKPAVIVSAGPSLAEDIEHIRHIKNKGLAYVFAVGSAINVLLAHHIFPDGFISYDPSTLNQKVMEKLITEKISTIPLIFGSSIAYEALQAYPGPKLHMMLSQDTISPYFLKRSDTEQLEVLADAPSVAVITLQMLNKLGCNPIILAGQNFAFKNDKRYASGIQYEHISSDVSEKEMKEAIKVKDVQGNEIYSNSSFLQMKVEMEKYTVIYNSYTEIINTTQGGAQIQGTSFVRLEDLIRDRLLESVVQSDYYTQYGAGYDLNHLVTQGNSITNEYNQFIPLLNQSFKLLADMNIAASNKNEVQLSKMFLKFDKLFKQIQKNKFYDIYILPMNRIHFEMLMKNIAEYKFERNLQLKMQKIVESFGKYLLGCQNDFQSLQPFFTQKLQAIMMIAQNNQQQAQNV
jgi:hypothetical protein